MIRERQTQMDIFEALLPFQTSKLALELENIDQILDENPIFLQEFTLAMEKRSKESKTLGRGSRPAEALLRMILLRRTYNLTFRETVQQVNDSLTLRRFTRIYYEAVPDFTTLCRYDNLIDESFLERLNKAIINIAREKKITKGLKMRSDTTVVEADIHYPTDSRLLYDGIKVLSRAAKKCRELGVVAGESARDFTRSAKKQLLHVVKYAKARSANGQQEYKKTYKKLTQITKRSIRNAKKQIAVLAGCAEIKALKIQAELEHFIPIIQKVIQQTERRLVKEEITANNDKVFSIFQPDVYCVRKGKSGKPNEFGKKVRFDQSDGKIITGWKIYDSNVSDTETFIPAINQHIKQFGKPPHLAAGDRGCYSAENEYLAYELGVKRVSLPKRGRKSKDRTKHEKQRWFKTGQRFRAGSEGTISVLKRRHGLRRCLNRGNNAFERWIGWGVIGANLLTIAHT
jgi:IS5 family transposase